MRNIPFISLLLAILHTTSGLLILIFSSWFLAACALMPVNFNYMLPAVIIRALALTRIGAGYGHMWLAHHDLLGRTTWLRSELFSRLKDHILLEKAGDVEKLAAQTEMLSSVWVGWVAHQASAVVLITLSVSVVTYLALPGAVFMWIMAALWLAISLWLVFFGLNKAASQAKNEQAFRFQSEHFFAASSLWHLQLNENNQQFRNAPQLSSVWQKQQAVEFAGQWGLWLIHGAAIAAIGALFWSNQQDGFGDARAIIVPMLLLSITDWLGRPVGTAAHLGKYRQAAQALKRDDAAPLPAMVQGAPEATIALQDFQAQTMPHGMSATLPVSGLVVLLGASGCGKSSLMKALAGLVPAQGELLFDGSSVAAGRREGWVYVEQSPRILEATLKMNLNPAEKPMTEEAMSQALAQFGLEKLTNADEWLGQGGRRLSGGESRRLSLARAKLAEPDVWLVDEPFEGLDEGNQQLVEAGLLQAAESRLVLVATHVLPAELADRAAQIIEM